ncbi:MAG: 2-succinyl-6-hydroxy-2,4-cyclohexadiene-1-carboxylate synthase [Phototrophicales bacterium]|nr:MAG: 2-succinyl-6-hydroxy-2,4-cyclohexadiene-1-carboxylate synthase [Phototrophicales bacterium]RMG71090.1 MAG: 2-succinyl-6-hydroxy-2,4-cyclohexadiene-1-carboxylate synthase [Chloroflexota bacterium]
MRYSAQLNMVRYVFTSQGRGFPLVMLHGFTGSELNWQMAAYTDQFEVIAPDLLGHGETESPIHANRYHIKAAARDIIALCDSLRLEKINLLGYSMGGRLALYLAVNYPERVHKLILESASPGLKTQAERDERRQRDEALAERIESEGIEAFVRYWESLPLWDSQTEAMKAQLRAIRLRHNPIGLANSLRGMGTGAQPSMWEFLPQLKMPVLLIAGALDEKFTTINQQMHTILPQSRLEVIPDAGHTVHLEKPNQFEKLVLEFLR